jgi:hypothetical protein
MGPIVGGITPFLRESSLASETTLNSHFNSDFTLRCYSTNGSERKFDGTHRPGTSALYHETEWLQQVSPGAELPKQKPLNGNSSKCNGNIPTPDKF